MQENSKENVIESRSRKFKSKFKRLMFGMSFTDGLIYKIVIYTLLVSFSYVYLYPLLFLMINSFMGVNDLINPGVKWVPTEWIITNYQTASDWLGLPGALFDATWYVLKASLLTTISSAVVGYGFAKYDFPFKKLLFVLMLITFILPQQITMAGTYQLLNMLKLMQTQNAILIPAMLGQGINAAIYILIFYQFFRSVPQVLTESAEIDGASQFKIFLKINLPLAIPSIVIVLLFSFVFYWNETIITGLITGKTTTLPLRMLQFRSTYMTLFPPGSPGSEGYEAIFLAGNMLVILPLLVLYFIGQRQFTESIDRTGITGE